MRPSASVRTWASRSAWLVAAVLTAPARADDPPLLAPPDGVPVPEAAPGPTPIPAPSPTPAPTAPSAPRADRPVLALPGVTLPTARPLPPAAPLPPSLASSPDGGLPALAPPSGSSALPASPSSRFRGRVIESAPADGLPAIDVPRSSDTSPRGPGMPSTLNGTRRGAAPIPLDEIDERDLPDLGGRKRTDEEVEKERTRDLPSSLPARRGMLGNRWVNPFLGPRPGMGGSDSAIRAEPRTDPAADALLKRRIERQAAAAVGDRARSVEVRVVGRSITIQARGVKLWQRRAVRRTLEGLPVLSGYRSVVELVD